MKSFRRSYGARETSRCSFGYSMLTAEVRRVERRKFFVLFTVFLLLVTSLSYLHLFPWQN